jgi:outer membrane usher protein
MASIMAPAIRLTFSLAGLLLMSDGWAQVVDPLATSTAAPGPYSLRLDQGRWAEDYSVFKMTVADGFGVIGGGFAASSDPRLKPVTRLDSSWTLTAPLAALPMRLGDSTSSSGLWGQPTRLGGVQIGTAPAGVPDVIAPPAAIAAPYETPGPSALAGNRFIEHLRSLIQFERQSLEKPGHADFSFETGRLRENFEMRSDSYGPWIASGSYRYGLNATTTVHGEAAQVARQQNFLGLGVIEGLGPGLVSARVAGSRDPDAGGWLARMGYDYRQDGMSIALRSHIQSPGYLEVGDVSTVEVLRQRTLASAGIDLGAFGKISLASATQTYLDYGRRDIIALSHAIPFGGGGVISTAAAYSPGPLGSAALLLSFTYPFAFVAAQARSLDINIGAAVDRTLAGAFAQMPRWVQPAALPFGVAGQPFGAVNFFRN